MLVLVHLEHVSNQMTQVFINAMDYKEIKLLYQHGGQPKIFQFAKLEPIL